MCNLISESISNLYLRNFEICERLLLIILLFSNLFVFGCLFTTMKKKLWSFKVKKIFIEIRSCNPMTYILKGMSKSLNISILNRLKIMGFFVNAKYIHKCNVILNKTVTKLFTILTKCFFHAWAQQATLMKMFFNSWNRHYNAERVMKNVFQVHFTKRLHQHSCH